MNRESSKSTELQLKWLRLKRHLRSCQQSTRALRDAARALSAETAILAQPMEDLCPSRSARLAA